ncbi:MAG: Dabb family protein [Bacteroidota bacterium]
MSNFRKTAFVILFAVFSFSGFSQEKEENKTLHHVLLIQWSEGHDTAIKDQVLGLFQGLPAKVEGLESFTIKKVEKSSGGFHDTLRFEFTSVAALEAYDVHPDHEKVKQLAPSIISGFAEYDYWD